MTDDITTLTHATCFDTIQAFIEHREVDMESLRIAITFLSAGFNDIYDAASDIISLQDYIRFRERQEDCLRAFCDLEEAAELYGQLR